MSIDLNIFVSAITLTMLFDTLLSVTTGFGGYGWPISTSAVLMDVSFYQFSNNYLNYGSGDNVMVFLIMLYSKCTGRFPGALLVLVCGGS